MKSIFWLTAILLTALVLSASAATWTVDPAHTNVQFTVKHMMVTPVRGTFNTFSGSANFDEKTPAVFSFEGTIDAASVNTNNDRRDTHLKSADFFDVATYPTITFKSTKCELKSPGNYKVTGDLSMHGVTKEIAMNMEGLTDFVAGPRGGTRAGLSLSGKISRHDIGLNWNKALEAGGVLVSDSVTINLDVELEKEVEHSAK